MVLGMSLATFTLLHVALSLVAILSGLVVIAGMIGARAMPGMTALFLATTILTSVTGYFFPFAQVLPSHIVGALSLVLLAVAVLGYYGFGLGGRWRAAYVITAVASLYLNVFVLVVQAFLKIGPLHAIAPTQESPAFVAAQGVVLLVFVWLGFKAVRGFQPAPALAPA